MSLIIKHFNMVLEITQDGELLFPDHELEYDIAYTAMGGKESPEMLFLDDWEKDPTRVFFSFALDHSSREEMLVAGRALVEEVVSLAGVVNIHGTNFENIGREIYLAAILALSGASGDKIEKLRDKMGYIGAALQQQKWLMSGSRMSWYFDTRVDPHRSVVDAATEYIHMVDRMHGVESFWEELGRKRVLPQIGQIAGSAIAELTISVRQDQADTWHPGELPIPVDFVPAAKKILVGAVVRALDWGTR